jgi:hypothetical protein
MQAEGRTVELYRFLTGLRVCKTNNQQAGCKCLAAACFAYSFALKMEAVPSSRNNDERLPVYTASYHRRSYSSYRSHLKVVRRRGAASNWEPKFTVERVASYSGTGLNWGEVAQFHLFCQRPNNGLPHAWQGEC